MLDSHCIRVTPLTPSLLYESSKHCYNPFTLFSLATYELILSLAFFVFFRSISFHVLLKFDLCHIKFFRTQYFIARLLVHNCRLSYNPLTCWRAVTLKWYPTHTVQKVCLQKSWITNVMLSAIGYHIVPFKKRRKYLWKSVATLLKAVLLHGCFWLFLNGKNDTKSLKAS